MCLFNNVSLFKFLHLKKKQRSVLEDAHVSSINK